MIVLSALMHVFLASWQGDKQVLVHIIYAYLISC